MTSLRLESRFRNRTSEDKMKRVYYLVEVPVPASTKVGIECFHKKSNFSFCAAYFHRRFLGVEEREMF